MLRGFKTKLKVLLTGIFQVKKACIKIVRILRLDHRFHQLGSLADSVWILLVWPSYLADEFKGLSSRISRKIYFSKLLCMISHHMRVFVQSFCAKFLRLCSKSAEHTVKANPSDRFLLKVQWLNSIENQTWCSPSFGDISCLRGFLWSCISVITAVEFHIAAFEIQ